MRVFKTIEEANECTAVRLTNRRKRGKTGDFFRLSPASGIFLWGRVMKRGSFFGLDAPFNLVYIYDFIGFEMPPVEVLSPPNLLIGPSVVNNLGFSKGYWEIVSSRPVLAEETLQQHVFIRFKGFGGREYYDIVNEVGDKLSRKHTAQDFALSQSGFGNFNSVDWEVRQVLEKRGVLPG